MNFVRPYARVLKRLGPEKRLAAALVVANVALAVSQFAEPMLFGKIIDQLTKLVSSGAAGEGAIHDRRGRSVTT